MHGRLKVRTTQEQEERKRLEREKKLKMYKSAMGECISRIEKKEYDQVGLKISEEILSSNGDVQTLWNFRKNILEHLQKTLSDDEMIKIFQGEIYLTEVCLKKNPKSYGSWYHRQWCLLKANSKGYGEKSVQLSWKNELNLCNMFLNADERNFHCWRHRFFVVKNGNLSKTDELEFTYEKICSNFSNYSSWHYRSKLIEELYYHDKIDSEIFKNELNLIENAIFTDPNDQSAWIYEKWLLLEHQRSFIKELSLDCSTSGLSFKFAREIDLNKDLVFLKLNNVNLKSQENFKWNFKDNYWTGNILDMDSNNQELKRVLEKLKQEKHGKIKVELMVKNSGLSNQLLLELDLEKENLYEFKSKFALKNLTLDSELILKHLNNILELNQLEQEKSKWCLLTSIELMCIIDYDKYKEQIFAYLDKLANEIDLYRRNFYLDLKQRIISNNSI